MEPNQIEGVLAVVVIILVIYFIIGLMVFSHSSSYPKDHSDAASIVLGICWLYFLGKNFISTFRRGWKELHERPSE